MPQVAEPKTTVGGLVVLNGKHRGERLPLRLPVTLIGSGAGCDVRLTAPGIGDIHCLLVASPVGLVVRSLFPGSTRLNDVPTSAAVLTHGSELDIGPCSFRVVWNGTTLPVEPADDADDRPSDYQLREREQAVHEQETQLAALLDEKQKQVADLLGQLADGRESVRQERAAIATDRAAAKTMRTEAEKVLAARVRDRERTRKAAARLLKRVRALAASDRASVERERQSLLAGQRELTATRDQLYADATAHADRLAEAWNMLAAGQQALAADRDRTEAELSTLFKLLDARTAEADAAAKKAETDRRERSAEGEALRSEIAGLERRLANLRPAIQALEEKRAGLLAELAPPPEPIEVAVPLDWRDDRSVDQILTDLLARERDLDRERQTVVAAREKLDRLAADMADERRVQAEQFAVIAADRRAEADTVHELQQLAEDIAAREQVCAEREQAADAADAARREREKAVWRFQTKLDRWQAALADYEARTTARLEQTETNLADRRAAVLGREHELDDVCRVWDGLRKAGQEAVCAELEHWAKDRSECRATVAEADEKAAALRAEVGKLATVAVSVEAVKAELAKTPRAKRRLRVMQRRWEGHFRRFAAELERRRKHVEVETAVLDTRFRELHRLIREALAAKAAADAARVAADQAAVKRGPVEEPMTLALVERTQADNLETVREEAMLAAADIEKADLDAGVLPLKYLA